MGELVDIQDAIGGYVVRLEEEGHGGRVYEKYGSEGSMLIDPLLDLVDTARAAYPATVLAFLKEFYA